MILKNIFGPARKLSDMFTTKGKKKKAKLPKLGKSVYGGLYHTLWPLTNVSDNDSGGSGGGGGDGGGGGGD